MYILKQYRDVHEFHAAVHGKLMEQEAANNLPLGLLNTILTSDKYKERLLLSVQDVRGDVVGTFIMTPPHYLVSTLQVKKEDIQEIITELHRFCENEGIVFPGFLGEKETTLQLADCWCKLTGSSYDVKMNQRVYKLEEVNDIPMSDGKMVSAGKGHEALLARWIMDFVDRTGGLPLSQEEALDRARDMIENEKYVCLWEVDGRPVSMARGARKTENGITVNFVYTPPEYRKKGYASSVVADLSRLLLKEHSFCTLYTDLENPTSNKIYMEIGYKPVCDSMMLALKEK
ncbi:GNAT family N-acetyltransferase [Bacillus sp. KH172YL63]|uniref:GNAT family N-acetyltransferase n=1 Tax=Bacillus sp. KH172YL63 TaxID=2709784 RepID=UPI0013E43E18|nr:GNAT family N-acetyltransferase [Bacillus sp. KH172YL63]BCB04352.1 acetyltransferase [Bacillus sp. KH172YL63]